MAAGASTDIVWTSFIPGLNWLEHHFVNPETHAPAYHVSNGILISLIILLLAVLGTSKIKRGEMSDDDLVPDAKLTIRNLLELMVTGIRGIMKDSLGAAAPKFLYLIGAFAFFILFSNLSGLVPGFMPPPTTSTPPWPWRWWCSSPTTPTASRNTGWSSTPPTSAARSGG